MTRLNRRSLTISTLLVVIVLSVTAGVAIILLINHSSPVTLPKSLVIESGLTVFVPSEESSLKIKPNSYSYGQGVLTYAVLSKAKVALVSEQMPPRSFDFDGLSRLLADRQTVHTSLGTAQVGGLESKTVGSLRAKGTWIFISTSADEGETLIKEVLTSLHQFKT